MDVEWILPYREAYPWSARATHALAALVGGALYTRLAVSQRRLPHQTLSGGVSASAALALDLVLLLPLLAVNAVLPFCFDSNGDELLSRLALAFMATWLGSFKAVGAALGRGPLAQAPWTPAQYVLLYAAPVYPSAGCTGGTVPAPKASSASVGPASSSGAAGAAGAAAGSSPQRAPPSQRALRGVAPSASPSPSPNARQQGQQIQQQQQQQRLQGRLADDAGSLAELLLALVGNASVLAACAYALVAFDIPPWPRMYVYALGLYGFVCVLMGVPAALIRGTLGVTLVPPFDKPWLSHSVADYWGRRWNNTTSLHLRSLVYDIVAEGCWVRPGGHAMAALGGGQGGGGAAAGGGGGGGAAEGAGGAAATAAVVAARLGSAGGLLASFLSSANLAEMAAAGSRPGSPDDRSARRRLQLPALRRDGSSSPSRAGSPSVAAAAAAPPSTPAGNTRSRARAAATATVTIASFDLEKRHPPHELSSPFRDGGGGAGAGGSVVSASPSPVRGVNGNANGNVGGGTLNGGGKGPRHPPAPPLVALAPAPSPSQLRRDLGVFAAFFVSAIFHEIILALVVPDASLGWWFTFFTMQAPLMVAERACLRWLRARGFPLPTLLRRAVTTVLLLAVSKVFFFTPIEVRSDLALRVAGAVTKNFAALAEGVSSAAKLV